MLSVCELVREAESDYTSGASKLSKYVSYDMKEIVETIDAYSNSQHTSGATDSQDREKPFFNIVNAIINVYYRATDIDRKNIRILPDSVENTALAFIATVILQNWMKEARFGVFLNEWGRALAKYGSAVVKFVEKDGKLTPSVVPWQRLVVDPFDFEALPRIEYFYKTFGQLERMATPGDPEYAGYDLEQVKLLKDTAESRETTDGEDKDGRANFIKVYEVHGLLPLSLLTGNDKDADTNRQQMHAISFVSLGTKEGKEQYQDFTLFKGREKKDPYMLTHLVPEEGRTLAIGPVEACFDAQWMVNHAMKNQKDTLDLASKLIFQTSDVNYAGRNVLTMIETGDIFVYDANKTPLTRIANDKPDITAFQTFSQQWQVLASDITSTPEAIRGQTLPSGTPYSLGAYLGGQAGSNFEQMTENKGLALEDMMREFILPHLMTKMDTKEEVVAILDENEIAEIDAMYIPRAAVRNFNERTIETMLSGGVPSPYQQDVEEQSVQNSLAALGNRRSFKPDDLNEKTWKEALKDFEMKAIVEVTNENTDKQAVLTTLATVFQTVASNPAVLQDKNARMLLNTILKETAVVSPIQLSTASVAPPQPSGANNTLEALTKTQQNG